MRCCGLQERSVREGKTTTVLNVLYSHISRRKTRHEALREEAKISCYGSVRSRMIIRSAKRDGVSSLARQLSTHESVKVARRPKTQFFIGGYQDWVLIHISIIDVSKVQDKAKSQSTSLSSLVDRYIHLQPLCFSDSIEWTQSAPA